MADLPPKGPLTRSAPKGGRKGRTMVIMMMMMMMIMIMMIMMMTIMIIMCFFIPKDLKQGWHQGEPIKYDDDDEIDDNDTDDDDNDDDDDDNNDGYGVFSSSERFFCRNLVFEAAL